MQEDEFFGGSFAFRILNPHTGLLSYPLTDRKWSESQGVTGGIVRGRKMEMQERQGAPGHPGCSPAPGTRALRRASFDGRNRSNLGALP